MSKLVEDVAKAVEAESHLVPVALQDGEAKRYVKAALKVVIRWLKRKAPKSTSVAEAVAYSPYHRAIDELEEACRD